MEKNNNWQVKAQLQSLVYGAVATIGTLIFWGGLEGNLVRSLPIGIGVTIAMFIWCAIEECKKANK